MDRSREALYALLAVTLGFVERARLLREWPAPEGIRTRLLSHALLTPVQADALDRVTEAHLSRHGGSAEAALAACSAGDPGLLSSLADEDRTPATPAVDDSTRSFADAGPAAPERFLMGAELGRGGLGRVVAAWDNRLRRDVAIKLVLDGLPPALLRRFAKEAEITGRLEHPNIVPVHDFGPQVGGGRLGLCMKKIQGRDLRKLLEDLAKGDDATRKKYSLPRLLRVFQDICLAMAFAHDRGVIHRDLKPSNIMIGDFGETLVVDWGLAKELGAEEEPAAMAVSPVSPVTATQAAEITNDGMVMGTPAYMSPEQAAGRFRDIDARSDIYALGAILYEMLTLRPPMRGESIAEVLTNVIEGRVVPPSERVQSSSVAKPTDLLRTIPPELEAICLRAMAFRRENRYASAMDLHDEIQLFLEGVKQRERQRELAEACLRRAEAARLKREVLVKEADAAEAESDRIWKTLKPHEDKGPSWAEEDRARAARRQAAEARAEEDRLVTEALGHDPGHAEARRRRAEMAWERFEAAERAGREDEAVLQRAVVEQFDDGSYRKRLEGTGTLEVRAAAFACGCLRDGRVVAPAELERDGYHRFSGRHLSGHPGAAGLAELESREPLRLRVHGAACRAEPVAADVWAWRFEESGRLLIPVTPGRHPAAREGGDAPPVAAAFEPTSPFRPRGPGVYLGRTPLGPAPMPMGSWLLLVAAPGLRPARVPVLIGRCAEARQEVTLYSRSDLGDDVLPVAAGAFHFQGDPPNPYSISGADPAPGDYAIARHPVTAGEYAAFLAALPPAEAARRVPREPSGPYWPGPPWRFQGARPPGECVAPWRGDWPVAGVSWEDAMAFAAWKRASTEVAWVLPTEEEWEKAARGVDARAFVCGPYLDDRWACLNRSFADGPRISPVTEFPHDESPYGVRGMAGNVQEHALGVPGPGYEHWRIMRGGAWTHTAWRSRATARLGDIPRAVARHTGFRLARLLAL